MGCRAELLKPVELTQLQFSDKALTLSSRSSGARCMSRSVLDRASWATFAWRLTLSVLRVSVLGLACRTAEARGDSTGAVLGQGGALGLIESFMMFPGASVCGLVFSHPEAQFLRRGVIVVRQCHRS